MGVRNKPSAARGPNPSAPIRQPQMRITSGVRHLLTVADLSAADCTDTVRLLRPNCCNVYAPPLNQARTGAEHSGSAGLSQTNIRDRSHLPGAWLVRTALFASVLAGERLPLFRLEPFFAVAYR